MKQNLLLAVILFRHAGSWPRSCLWGWAGAAQRAAVLSPELQALIKAAQAEGKLEGSP